MPAGAAPGRPFEVLVVDDEADVRELLVEYFRDRGFEVSAAADGRAAITAIERAPARFGLIMTDLQLPGADGLAVLRAAREASPSSYVVIITGYASLDSAIQAVRFGAYDYLTKPFSLGQIDVIVNRLTDRMALETENRQLSRQMGERGPERETGENSSMVLARLDALDSRLARIETLLGEVRDHRLERIEELFREIRQQPLK
jgi:two-component system, NtrC family, response regulator AtoC